MSENARNTDPETSHAGAAAFSRIVLERVKEIYDDQGQLGLTDEELEAEYLRRYGQDTCHRSSPRKRRSDLTRDGFIKDSGLRRKSASGVNVVVWELTFNPGVPVGI